ncbi:hypothetical protein NCS57_00015100 [Fusarium keratoplasticum]|uniref:Uncharacterized protein n=1 Tax=Fusarium keratoplasticum TaxID=1328300 RepID=A0ACC0RBS5_9HYPO|nr:hypothetical protein NCS57_00015100 [Fusarium keratoplasticum]KAI8683507.1 hypothetical protein NCS57_00015100 [Fusarium keratoplasticum]KAI8687628.1 hypothetical protein NCS55_00014600 [Fusarium keratoplasticum]
MDGISGAVGLFSLILPAVTSLNSRICKVVGEISETKRAAQDPKVLKQLQEELATWDQVLQSINNIKGSDGQLIVKATSHCKKYEKALLKTNKCLERFRQTEVEDWGEITKILLKLNDLRKSHERHRKEVERWILSINTIMVNLTHEKLTRHEKRYSEASDAQAHKLESIHERIEGIEALLKNLSRDHNTMQQTERTSPVAELAAIADDLRTICSQQIVESVVSMRTRDEMYDSSCEEDVSEVGSKDSLEGSFETRRQGSLTTRSQGTQTMLSYPNHDDITDFVDSNPTPTSSRLQLEEYSNDESAWDTGSRNECFSEIGSSSSFTTGHLDGGVDVMDQARPEDDFDQYTASNIVLKKLESSTIKECERVVAGSFGQATRGGPEVLTMDSEEWHKGVWERFWFSKGYTIGIAFERDWGPFQSDLGLATLSNALYVNVLESVVLSTKAF